MNAETLQAPLLIQLAQPQHPSTSPPTKYDSESDELLVLVNDNWIPAVDSDDSGPVTKKKDIEKGEDEKDQW